MLTAYAVAQIRQAEQTLMARLPDGELMRRAASGLCDAVLSRLRGDERVIALIGTGNNGGDALFAAGLLRRAGIHTDVCLVDPARTHEAGLAAALAAGVNVVDTFFEVPDRYDVALDGVLGIGARAGLHGVAARWASWLRQSSLTVVCVDVPSGVAADDPRLREIFMPADAGVTFGAYKVSSLVDPAANIFAGVPDLIDIGLGALLGQPRIEALQRADCAAALRRLGPQRSGQKYSRGVVGIAAGSTEYAGAAHLCVAGAQNGLSGMVRFAGTDELGRRVVDRAPEVVAARGRVQAWAVGSGAGADAGDHLRMALADGVPVLVDADALEHIPDTFNTPALLTPHAGELAAMMHTTREAVEADPLRHVEEAARRWNATVLLKGRRTLIATAQSTTGVNLTGTPWLATAGSGDVLAGLAGSLLAAGADPHTAGAVAAFVHGAAAQRASGGGPITAGDVATAIPAIITDLLTGRGDV